MLMLSQDKFIQSIYNNDLTKLTLAFYASPHVAIEISSFFLQISSHFTINIFYHDIAFFIMKHFYHNIRYIVTSLLCYIQLILNTVWLVPGNVIQSELANQK